MKKEKPIKLTMEQAAKKQCSLCMKECNHKEKHNCDCECKCKNLRGECLQFINKNRR